MRALLFATVLLLATACSTPGYRTSSIPVAELVSGDTLALPAPPAPLITRDDAMALDGVMRTFVDEARGANKQDSVVMARLVRALSERGFFNLEYVIDDTYTASQTFHTKRGNCISFTLMFVALARAAGLTANFQIVDVPPKWDSGSELTVIANHINVLIELATGHDFVVDFNESSFNSRYAAKTVSDERALALFFNNLGAEALLRRDYAIALHYFKEAITADTYVADPWVNLGLLYARHKRYAHAEAAYLHALKIEPLQGSALTNLAALYDATGDTASAEALQDRIHRYQQRNPYYHFVEAQQAYEDDRLEDAEQSIMHAIRLKRDEHEFYHLLGLTQIELGKLGSAERSFSLARDYAASKEQKSQYDTELANVREAQKAVASNTQ